MRGREGGQLRHTGRALKDGLDVNNTLTRQTTVGAKSKLQDHDILWCTRSRRYLHIHYLLFRRRVQAVVNTSILSGTYILQNPLRLRHNPI